MRAPDGDLTEHPADRGLTYRMLLTGLFFVLLYGLVIGILIAVLHSSC